MDVVTEDVAIVIPVLHDHAALAQLASRIAQMAPAPREVAVVSAEPDSDIANIAATHGFELLVAEANRGAQLDAGARATRASALWFVHADADIPLDAIASIRDAFARGLEAGCFAFEFQGPPTLVKTLLGVAVRARVRCGGMAYGDQALFCTRAAYEACGGFSHDPLFEEVRLVRALRRRGKFRMLGSVVRVATRRWERDGWLRRTIHNRWLALCHTAGVPAGRLAAAYRGNAHRRLDERT
jgi:rSAM/selenodomain-associated transferase 2